MSASPTIGAATCRSTAASTISTASASSSTASGRRLRGLQEGRHPLPRRNSPRAPGRPATISRRSPPARSSSANFPARSGRRMQAMARQPAARALPRRARAPGDRAVLRLRMDASATCSTAPTSARNSCFERSDYKAEGLPVAAGTGAARAAARRASRRGLRRGGDAAGLRRLGPRPQAARRRRRSCSPRPAGSGTGSARRNDKGERLTLEILVEDDGFVRVDLALGREHAGDRHRRLDPAWSIPRSIRRGRPISTST